MNPHTERQALFSVVFSAVALLLAALVLFLAGCSTVTGARALAITATAADVSTTLSALNRGAVEVNPIYGQQNVQARVIAVNAILIAAVWYLVKDASPDTQRMVWNTIAVLRLGAATWNASQLKGAK
jgi:hypothetical protein